MMDAMTDGRKWARMLQQKCTGKRTKMKTGVRVEKHLAPVMEKRLNDGLGLRTFDHGQTVGYITLTPVFMHCYNQRACVIKPQSELFSSDMLR
jgi:hypothetical protein